MSIQIQLIDTVVDGNECLFKMFPELKNSRSLDTNLFVYERVVEFAEFWTGLSAKLRKLMENPSVIAGKTVRLKDQKTIWTWCQRFYKHFTNGQHVHDLTNVAESLGNEVLNNLSLCVVAQDIDNLSVVEFRRKYNLINDLTDDEIAQLNKEEEIYKNSIK